MNNNIQETLFKTIETITDSRLKQVKFDKTIEAIVVSDAKAEQGEYELKYQDVIFVAYSSNNTVKYAKDSSVLVLVPQGDMSNRKTIISSSKKEGEDFVDIGDQLDRVGINLVDEPEGFTIELSTTSDEEKTFRIKKAKMIELYPNKKKLAIGAEIITNINSEDIDGMYGIAVDCIFKTKEGEKVPHSFIFNTLDVTGNPYHSRGYKEIQLPLVEEELVEVVGGRAFSEGFSKGHDNIVFKNLTIEFLALKEEDKTGCTGKIIAPKGAHFKDGELHPDDKLDLVMEFRQHEEVLATDAIKYKWFFLNGDISSEASPGYDEDGGLGWELLTKGKYAESLISGVDTSTLSVAAGFVPSFSTFKCVANYEKIEVKVTDSITVVDHTDPIKLEIVSSNGTSFVNGVGHTTLSCEVTQKGKPVELSLEYEWAKVEENSDTLEVLQKGKNKTYYVDASKVGQKTVYICEICLEGQKSPIAKGFITLVNVVSGNVEGVVVYGGFRTVLYDGDGKLDETIQLNEFQFDVFSGGQKVQDGLEWTWKIPADDKTLLRMPEERFEILEDGTQVCKDRALKLSIDRTFDYHKMDNTVELEVKHTIGGVVNVLTDNVPILVAKVGATGAEGPAGGVGPAGEVYVYQIMGGNPTILYDKDGLNPEPNPLPEMELMFSVNGDMTLAKDVPLVTWELHDESECLLSFEGEENHIRRVVTRPDPEKPDENPHKIRLVPDEAFSIRKYNNWLKATISYKGRTFIETQPIMAVKNGEDGTQGVGYTVNVNGGARGIAYSAIGTNPEPRNPGEFTVELLKNGEVVEPSEIVWSAGGNYSGRKTGSGEEGKTFTPKLSPEYLDLSTFVKVVVRDGETSVAKTVPIVCTKHANGLDWIKDWDDNKTKIDDEFVVSPKIFAGKGGDKPSGVALGRNIFGIKGSLSHVIGLAGYKDGVVTFHLSDEGDLLIGDKNKSYLSYDGKSFEVSADSIKFTSSQHTLKEQLANMEKDYTTRDATLEQSINGVKMAATKTQLRTEQMSKNIRCQNVGAKINHGSFTEEVEGKIYIHGYNGETEEPSDTSGLLNIKGGEVTLNITKGTISTGSRILEAAVYICGYIGEQNTYGVYYDKGLEEWRYAGLIGSTATGKANVKDDNYICYGNYRMKNSSAFSHAYLLNNPLPISQAIADYSDLEARIKKAEFELTPEQINMKVSETITQAKKDAIDEAGKLTDDKLAGVITRLEEAELKVTKDAIIQTVKENITTVIEGDIAEKIEKIGTLETTVEGILGQVSETITNLDGAVTRIGELEVSTEKIGLAVRETKETIEGVSEKVSQIIVDNEGIKGSVTNALNKFNGLKVGSLNYILKSDSELKSSEDKRVEKKYFIASEEKSFMAFQGQPLTLSCEVKGTADFREAGMCFVFKTNEKERQYRCNVPIYETNTGEKRISATFRIPHGITPKSRAIIGQKYPDETNPNINDNIDKIRYNYDRARNNGGSGLKLNHFFAYESGGRYFVIGLYIDEKDTIVPTGSTHSAVSDYEVNLDGLRMHYRPKHPGFTHFYFSKTTSRFEGYNGSYGYNSADPYSTPNTLKVVYSTIPIEGYEHVNWQEGAKLNRNLSDIVQAYHHIIGNDYEKPVPPEPTPPLPELPEAEDPEIIVPDLGNLGYKVFTYIEGVSAGELTITKPKIEIGTIPTDWTPSPMDLEKDLLELKSEIKMNEEGITSTVSKINKRIDGISVGGYNYILKSGDGFESDASQGSTKKTKTYKIADPAESFKSFEGKVITLSCDIEGDADFTEAGLNLRFRTQDKAKFLSCRAEKKDSLTGKQKISASYLIPEHDKTTFSLIQPRNPNIDNNLSKLRYCYDRARTNSNSGLKINNFFVYETSEHYYVVALYIHKEDTIVPDSIVSTSPEKVVLNGFRMHYRPRHVGYTHIHFYKNTGRYHDYNGSYAYNSADPYTRGGETSLVYSTIPIEGVEGFVGKADKDRNLDDVVKAYHKFIDEEENRLNPNRPGNGQQDYPTLPQPENPDTIAPEPNYTVELYIRGLTRGNLTLTRPKIEIGSVPTDWTPNPDDYPSMEQFTEFKQSAENFQFTVRQTGVYNLLRNSRPIEGNLTYWETSHSSDTSKPGFEVASPVGGENYGGQVFRSGIWWYGKNSSSGNGWVLLANTSINNLRFNQNRKYTIDMYLYSNSPQTVQIQICDRNNRNVVYASDLIEYSGEYYQRITRTFTPQAMGSMPEFRIVSFRHDSRSFSYYFPYVNLYEGEMVYDDHLPDGRGVIEGRTTIDTNGIKCTFEDGSYASMGRDGFKYKHPEWEHPYQYITKVIKVRQKRNGYWEKIFLGPEFKGKRMDYDFKVTVYIGAVDCNAYVANGQYYGALRTAFAEYTDYNQAEASMSVRCCIQKIGIGTGNMFGWDRNTTSPGGVIGESAGDIIIVAQM